MKTKALSKFREVVDNRHEYARERKAETGYKVVGCWSTYVPEEILYAANILPVRISGSHEVDHIIDSHVFMWLCPYSRDCLAQGLKGRYNYLDGIVIAHSCIHMRQAFDSWEKHVPVSYSRDIYVPAHVSSPHAKACFVKELDEFKRSLEQWTGSTITEEALRLAINVYNTNRRLLKRIYELRKANNPAVSGAEAMEIVLASQIMDKEEHNRLLLQALEELSSRKLGSRDERKPRLMIMGSENDDTEFVRLTESLGADVVIDDHCTGTRYFWNNILPSDNLLTSIAARYLDKPRCPQKDISPDRRRLPYILKLVKDFNVHGAILIQQKFCDRHAWDVPAIQSLLSENNVPSMVIELDIVNPEAQLRTRIQALLEMLQPVMA